MNLAEPKLSESSERIDLLLALAFTFSRKESRAAAERTFEEESAEDRKEEQSESNPLDLLSEMQITDRRLVENRAAWLLALDEQEQTEWALRTLARARHTSSEESARVNENIHPSHIIEALRREPVRIQMLLLRHLPDSLRKPAGDALGIAKDYYATAIEKFGNHPVAKIETVAVRAFLSNFVSAEQVIDPTPLDHLSGIELARLARLIGARETALACRSIAAVETLSSFLRRFPAEDSHAIAAFISALTNVEPERVSRAAAIVRSAMDAGAEPAVMLDRIGISMIACALRNRSKEARLFIMQKLPLEAARELEIMIDDGAAYEEGESLFASEEIEALAASLRSQTSAEYSEREPRREIKPAISNQRVEISKAQTDSNAKGVSSK